MTVAPRVHKTKGEEWEADGVQKTPKALSAPSVPEGEGELERAGGTSADIVLYILCTKIDFGVGSRSIQVIEVWRHNRNGALSSSWQYDQGLYTNPNQLSLERQFARSILNKVNHIANNC